MLYTPNFPMFFIKLFDNEEYDCRTPEDWLALGNAEGSPDRKPIPGKALLPTDDEIANGKASCSCCIGCCAWSWSLAS